MEWPWQKRQRARDEAQLRRDREDREERRLSQEAFLTSIASIVEVVKSASTASAAQATAFQAFIDSFNLTSAPSRRPFDEEEDVKRFLEARHMTGESNEADQYKALIAKMDEFDLQ